MKALTVSLVLLLTSLSLFSQEKNTLYFNISPLATSFYDYKESIDGGGSYSGKGAYTLGVEYSRELLPNLDLLLGVQYANNKIDYEAPYYPDQETFKGSFNLNYITIPVQLKYNFANFLFVNAGGFYNLQVGNVNKERYTYDKNRIGAILGLGGEYEFGENLCFSLNPYFQINNLSSNREMSFYNLGVKFGLGYKF